MKIFVIGGGASGMFLTSKLNMKNVFLLERNSKLGKKLVLTGNGHCNFTNSNFNNFSSIYNNDFFTTSFKNFNNFDLIEYFNTIGIDTDFNIYNNDKYFYPKSNDAKSVYYNLYDKIIDNNVNIIYNSFVNNIMYKEKKYYIYTNENTYIADVLIIATGGMSYKNTGSDGSMYKTIKELGHNIITPLPALTCLYYSDENLRLLKGIRVNCKSSLYIDNEDIDEENGEVQFSDCYISGIPIMNLSRKAILALSKKKEVYVKLNFTKFQDEKEFFKYMFQRKNKLHYKFFKDFLCGFINDNVMKYIICKYNLYNYSNIKMSKIDDSLLNTLSKILFEFNIKLTNKYNFEKAQITQGGVDTNEINPISFESKILPNLYFIGEVINIDGKCGGYNLQFAFSSAASCCESIMSKFYDKN